MAHRLEQDVKNAADTITPMSRFHDLLEGLYKAYSMCPKNQLEIDIIAIEFSIELIKVPKVFDVRWVFSSFMSVKVLLRNVPALFGTSVNCRYQSLNATQKKNRNSLAL